MNCLVAPVTMKAINATAKEDGDSQGVVVDRAIALLAFGEEVAKIKIPTATPSEKPPVQLGGQTVTMRSTPDGRTVHKYNRGIRQKGDKGR